MAELEGYGELRVRAGRAYLRDTILLWIHFRQEDGKYQFLRPDWSEPTDLGNTPALSEPPGCIDLQKTQAQALMDDLWSCGLRPTEGSGSAGALAATEKHLADMQRLVFEELLLPTASYDEPTGGYGDLE